jgi:Zn-dependent protease
MEMTIIQKIAIWALPLIFAIPLHEVAHGWVASWFGDQTARLSGRLSLNPIKHIDLVGTIVVPLLMLMVSSFIFGWAKPVPVDPRNLNHPRRDMAFVSLAGPVSNLLMAVFWGAIAKVGIMILDQSGNSYVGMPLAYMGGAGIIINIMLGVLNLLPLPPLDGGKFLLSLLPPRMAYKVSMIEPYGFFILIALAYSGVLSIVMTPFVYFFIYGLKNLFELPSFVFQV